MMIHWLKHFLKTFLYIIICSQLIFYPTWSFSQNTVQITSDITEAKESADRLNKHIESLYNSVFGRPLPSEYYQNHPLDVYSLIGQETNPYQTGQRLIRSSWYGEALDPQKAGEELPPIKPYPAVIKKDRIAVEVLDSEGNVRGVISSLSKHSRHLQGDASYAGQSYQVEDLKEAYRFQIKHQEQVLHTFSNHIKWISFFGPYLVFMEPAQIYTSEKAFISFIDLNYFESALGKTALPLFRIPVVVDAQAKINTLLNPEEIIHESATEVGGRLLKIQSGGKEYKITRSEIDLLARAQQLSFNVTVSLIDIKRYENNVTPFIESVSETVEELAKKGADDISKKDYTESYRILQEVISLQFNTRSSVGSPADNTGRYAGWRTSQFRLNHHKENLNPEQKDALQTLNEHLEQDQLFQESIKEVGDNHALKKTLGEKVKGFYIFLTMPQPLGAPKILEGLGKIAGAVQTNQSLQYKAALVREGIKQMSANRKMRVASTAFLAGAVSIAAPEAADFYSSVFQWGVNWKDIIFNTLKTGTAGFFPETLYEAYLSESKRGPSATGLFTLSITLTLLFITPHTLINLKKFLDYKKSKKAQDHEEKVKSFWNRWEARLKHPAETYQRFRTDFIDFEQNTQNEFYNNLIKAELRNIGLPVKIQTADGESAAAVFQINMRGKDLAEAYKTSSQNNINLKIYSNNAPIAVLQTAPQLLKITDTEKEKVQLILQPSETETAARTFVFLDGSLNQLLKTDSDSLVLKDKLSMGLTITSRHGETVASVEGAVSSMYLSKEDRERVRTALNEIKAEKTDRSFFRKIIRRAKKSQEETAEAAANTPALSTKQIHNMGQAMLYFFSYANWTSTYQFFIKLWNKWFFFRSAFWKPVTGLKILLYEEYFNRIYTERHKATFFNGAHNLRRPHFFKQSDGPADKVSGKTYLQALKEFEAQIIPIERQYIRASAEEAYRLALDMYMKEPEHNSKLGSIIRSGVVRNIGGKAEHGLEDDKAGNFQLDLNNVNKKSRLFLELYQRMLFKESMRDFLKEKAGLEAFADISDKEIKETAADRIYKGNGINLEQTEDIKDARTRVKKVSEQLNLNEKTEKAMSSFFNKFFEKWAVRRERKADNFLNPNTNRQLERYEIANQAQKDPEALARTTRAELAEMIIDKPFEIVFLFLLLAGADYAILEMVQEERFSETAFFHLSRFAVWQGFIFGIVFSILGNPWFKVQMDSRLAAQGGFKNIPTIEDVQKKFGGAKWYWKQFRKEQNSFKENYFFSWRLTIANFTAALPTFILIYGLTLGRFDLELFANVYIWTAFGLSALLFFKMENGYESYANFSLKELIKKGFDFKEKDKALLSHPDILAYKIKEANKSRRNYNLLNASFINNPIGSIMMIMETIGSNAGSFGLMRQFTGGKTLTEYWVNLMDIAEQKGGFPKALTSACKKAFTNNRMDL